ncbi:MAG: hypothetical protein QOJ64_1694 [Acidobacteriota bacterium]|jgi:hypothetical protein|nr:hypothetical protein [Acidobacteriota bacterium]
MSDPGRDDWWLVRLGWVVSFPIILALWWLGAVDVGSLLPSRLFHLRGEFDRATRHIRDCTSERIYDLPLTSGGAYRLLTLEDQLHLTDGDVLIIEFDAHTIPPKLPWDPVEAVGTHSDFSLVRGTCADAADRPNQAMQLTAGMTKRCVRTE